MLTDNREDRGGVQVIARAASILRSLENKPDGLSLGELATVVGLARSTVQRIVKALTDEQLLIAASTKSGVKIGPALVRLASAFKVDMEQLALPFMRDLSSTVGETVDLSVRQGKTAVFVAQVLGTERLAAVSHVGDAFPLFCTANGKALLSCVPVSDRARLVGQSANKGSRPTPGKSDQLDRDIDYFLEHGIAFDREEHTDGISAIGTAFLDPFGQAYALSIPVPTPRFNKKVDRLEEALLSSREAIVSFSQGRLPTRLL